LVFIGIIFIFIPIIALIVLIEALFPIGGFIGVVKGKDWLIIVYAAFLIIAAILEFVIIAISGGDAVIIITALVYALILIMIFYHAVKFYRLVKGL
jgi:hypothetical protein